MNSKHLEKIETISKWSGGYPLLVKLIGQAEELSIQILDEAINVLIEDVLIVKRQEISAEEVRDAIQKLALISKPFRIPDVDTYLFPGDERRRLKADRLIKTLLQSYLLFWSSQDGRNGYMLNDSVAHPIKEWLQESPELLKKYQRDWETGLKDLQQAFPTVDLQEYHKMLALQQPITHAAK